MSKSYRKFIVFISLAGLIFTGIFASWQLSIRWLDPAYYAAKPLEAALVEAGGEPKCSTGNSGMPPNSPIPHRITLFEFPDSFENAKRKILSAVRSSGFTYAQTESPIEKEEDLFIGEQVNGSAKILVNIYPSKAIERCGVVAKTDNGTSTTIRITISLPERKMY